MVDFSVRATDKTPISKIELLQGTTSLGVQMGKSTATFSVNTMQFPDGSTQFTAQAIDSAGQMGSATLTLSLRNHPLPMVMFTAPQRNARVSGTVRFGVQASSEKGIAKLELFQGTMSLGTASSEVAEFPVDTFTLPDGSTVFTAEATDRIGTKARIDLPVILDNHSPPQINVVRPMMGVAYDGRLTLEATASSPYGPIRQMTLAVDAMPVRTATGAPYKASVDTTQMREGSHRATFVAIDAVGNMGMAEAQFLVNRGRLSVRIDIAPRSGPRVMGTFGVTVTASPAASIASIEARTGTVTRTSTRTPLRYSVNTLGPPRIPNGPYAILATAHDRTIVNDLPVGNVATATAAVIIDNIPPEPHVELLTPRNRDGVFRLMAIRASVTSPVMQPIARVEVRVNGRLAPAPMMMMGTPIWETTFDFSRMTGTATITVTAWDMANNMGSDRAVVSIVPPPTFRVSDTATPAGTANGAGYDVGDINGDGLADIVVGGSEISVLTGTISRGQFGFLPPRHIGEAAQSVRLAHVAMTNALDIVALRGSTFAVYTNNGDGTFANPVVTMTGMGSASDLQVADVNGDQYPDVVIGIDTAGAGDFMVFLSNHGQFSVGTTYGRVGTVTEAAIGPLTMMNHQDIVVGRSGNSLVTVYLNDGAGHFGAGTDTFADGPARSVAIGDVTGDGYPDIVAVLSAGNQVIVLAGVPATPGAFRVAGGVSTQIGPSGVVLADLHGQGHLDMVVSLTTGSGIDVFFNTGTGNFTRAGNYVMTRDAVRPRLYNLFRNGRSDVIVTSQSNNEIAFAKNLGNGNFRAAPATVTRLAPTAIASGHLLGSGNRVDIALPAGPDTTVMPTAPAKVQIFRNSPTSFPATAALEVPLAMELSQPSAIAIGDLDGRNGLDIAIGSSNSPSGMSSPTAMLLLSNGADDFTSVPVVGLDHPQSVAIGDVDNDGVGEAIFSVQSGMMMRDDGSAVVEADGHPIFTVLAGHGASSVAIGSFNGRTLTDYAVSNPTTNDITVNLWNGHGFNTTTYSALTAVSAITIGRVARHTINDIVGVSSQFGVVILTGRPGSGFDTPLRYEAGPSPSGVVGGDFNRDGLYDVMVTNPSNATVSLLIASPQGGFFAPITITMPSNPVGFTVADFDGDGRDDLAVATAGAPAFTIVFSNGDSL